MDGTLQSYNTSRMISGASGDTKIRVEKILPPTRWRIVENSSELRVDDLELIDRICDQFSAELARNPSVSIHEFASRAPEQLRSRLASELVIRHVEFRRAQGEIPQPEDYVDVAGESVPAMVLDGFFDVGDSADSRSPSLSTVDQPIPQAKSPAQPPTGNPPPEFRVGRMIGRYRLEEFLGRGSFGEVWRAVDTKFSQNVALKLLRPDRVSPEMVCRFEQEAARHAVLRGVPGIVTIYDVGEHEGAFFLVSEYVPGGTLRHRIKGLSREDRLRIVAETARVLQRAHACGIVHRDVKPANILLDADDRPILTDFGIAATQRELVAEPDHAIVGTFAYMAPEQIAGRSSRVDPRTDVYALGVLLHECLLDERPFQAFEGDLETLREAILSRSPWPPRSRDDTIPREVERVCLRCLAKEPGARFASAGDVANELLPGHRSMTRRLWLGGAASVAVAFALWSAGQQRPAPEPEQPQLRHRPYGRDTTTWRVLESGRAIRVQTTGNTLFEVWPQDEKSYRFSAVVFDEKQQGWVGVAFGIEDHGNDGAFQFRRLEIESGNPPSVLGVVHGFDPGGRPIPNRVLGYERLLPEWSGTALRIEIVVEDGLLESILINDRALPELVEKLNTRGPVAGSVGLWCNQTQGRFSEPELDGTPVLLDRLGE